MLYGQNFAPPLPETLLLQVTGVVVVAGLYAHHDTALLDTRFIFLGVLVRYARTDQRTDQTTGQPARTGRQLNQPPRDPQ